MSLQKMFNISVRLQLLSAIEEVNCTDCQSRIKYTPLFIGVQEMRAMGITNRIFWMNAHI